jgi:hypothetical protein
MKIKSHTVSGLREAICAYCEKVGSATEAKQLFPGLFYKFVQDGAGAIIVCLNKTTCAFMSVILDGEDCVNMGSSRASSGGLIVHDTIPPASQQIMMIMTPKPGANKYGLSLAARITWDSHNTVATHVPPLIAEGGQEGEDGVPPILGIHEPTKLAS